MTPSERPAEKKRRRRRVRVALLHSDSYADILHRAMQYIHQDRDVLLAALLDFCGFLEKPPKFFKVYPPKRATRKHMERFHAPYYLDLLECNYDGTDEQEVRPLPSFQLLESMGLTDDCPMPTHTAARADLWRYCRYMAGASLHAAHLLSSDSTDVAIHWGGGRHHAHAAHAGGFCFVNDVVLALDYLRGQSFKTLYLDIDIHHSDGVQRALYDTDQVLTVSFHRYAAGFFPFPKGSVREKGQYQTPGVGHNLNLPLPSGVRDADFLALFQHTLTSLCGAYDPKAVVLCVGADGLQGDPLVASTDAGWNLSPEGIAECVRLTADLCGSSKRKLLLLGAGGYDPAATARTFLLCTAAACEGARPGMLWSELPKDVPRHDHFERYGPDFRLVDDGRRTVKAGNSLTDELFPVARQAVDLTVLYLQGQQKNASPTTILSRSDDGDDQEWWRATIPPPAPRPRQRSNDTGCVLSGAIGGSAMSDATNMRVRPRRRRRKNQASNPKHTSSGSGDN